MQSGRRVLLVGDHLQLPPTYSLAIQDKTAQILGISRTEFRAINSFQRAFFSAYGKVVGRTLLKQYRMAGAISRLVSHCFYEKALEVGRDPPGPEYQTLPGYLRREVVWLDTAEMEEEHFTALQVE
jgi:superfamily I DNA and/or RNA helicase